MPLRIVSVIIAILIWISVVNVSDPIIETTYTGVQVEIVNADAISKQNQTYAILDDTDMITVTVAAKRSINDLLGKENIKATADMSTLNEEKGTVRIKLETNKYNDKIESIKAKSEYVEVSIETLMKKQLAITPVITGDPEEGYVTGDVSLDQNVVTVQGPESVVSQIAQARIEASIAGMNSSISTTSMIRFYDANGELVDSTRLTENIYSVNLKVDILQTKELDIKFNTSGEPKEGYGIAGDVLSTLNIKTVTVAGKPSVLSGLTALNVPATALDIEGADKDVTAVLDLSDYLPDGVILVDKEEVMDVEVIVPIAQITTKAYKVPKDNIIIADYDSNKMTIAIDGADDSINVTLKGLPNDLDEVDSQSLSGEISVESYMAANDISELKSGTYKMPLTIKLPAGVSLEKEMSVTCSVKIK